MKEQPFVIERTYKASIEKVWKAISNREQMKQWYFDLAAFEPKVGFEFSFYGGTPEKSYLHLCQVMEVVPGKKLSYSWRYDGFPGNSLVTFELFKEGSDTRLRLTHEGLETFPQDNPDFAPQSFAAGWTEITGSMLKEFVEKSES
jgi:uncharacterized protein YndB with AHSA1/START domain